jgi:prepilin-type N-terminal cleavage/methylation domain-containing protein
MFKRRRKCGFTLIEVVASLAVLTLITTSVLVVMNRCIEAAIDSRARIQAFEMARENMEKLLGKDSVQDTTEFGISEINPDLRWETVVETFYEPITSRTWVQGICSAGYTDSDGEIQTVELTCWLTDVTESDLKKIRDQEKREKEYLEELAEMDAFGDDAEGLMMHAEYLILIGDYAGAAEILEDLLYNYPESAEAARAETMLRNIEEELSKMDSFGNDAIGLLQRAEYLMLKDDYEAAVEILEELLYNFPESDEAVEAEEMLQEIPEERRFSTEPDNQLQREPREGEQ